MSVIVHKGQQSFAEFYTGYLSAHENRQSRQLHFFASTLCVLFLAILALTGNPWWLLAAVLSFYGFSWLGHVWFEKNQPVSFKHPAYSFAAAWLMYWQMLSGQISF